MTNPETIIAAALYDGVIFTLPAPARHGTIQISANIGDRIHSCVQGFITSTGRFVNRVEAAEIAYQSGQCKKLISHPDLYSEDLW